MTDGSGEGRVAGEIQQYGCAMTGFAFHLVEVAGDLAVVVFGERDCANAFPRPGPELGRGGWNVFTAALRETDVVAGLAEARLEECLRAVVAARRPRAIVVLTTCVTGMIGAEPEGPCRAVEADTGVRIVPVHAGGLKPRTQPEIADAVARLLAGELAVAGPVDPDAVNLVGIATERPREPWRRERTFAREAREVLGRLGLRLNAAVPVGTSVDDWAGLRRAPVSFVVDRALYAGLLALLERDGHRVVEVHPPKGLAMTDRFYRAVAGATGRDAAAVRGEGRDRAEAAVARARTRLAGRRVAYGIGSQHDFRADRLALEGLGDLPLLVELGLEVEVVVQERETAEAHGRIRRSLAALGIDVPYRLFYEPAVLAPVLRDGGFHLAYVADFLADQAARAGVPLVPFGSLPPGWDGAAEAADRIAGALDRPFDTRYRRYL